MTTAMAKALFILPAILLLSGCVFAPNNSAQTAIPDGGVWRSTDAGRTFLPASDILTTKGKIASLINLDVNNIALDPEDSNAVYLSTPTNGIFYSLDAGNSWSQFKNLNTGAIRNVAVDYQDKCIVYAISGNKLFKTENCGRDFNNIYFHQKSQVNLTALAVSQQEPKNVYLGTSEGEVLKSIDGGHGWLTVNRVSGDQILDLIVDPADAKIIYAATARSGIYKSIDNGINWLALNAGLASYSGSLQYKKLVADPATVHGFILVSKFGLLRTVDGGNAWNVIELLPANKTTPILALAVNPKNSEEFYYTTATTLVKTVDGGVTWTSVKLPYNRATSDIEINPASPNIIYLAGIKSKN